MNDRVKYLKRLGTEVVYFSNEYEKAVIKSMPGNGGQFVKFKGAKEFKAHPDSSVVTDALLEQKEISKEEYEKF